jgi:hypothetical protein
MTRQSLPILVKLYPRQQILDYMELGRSPGLFSKLSGDQLHPELVVQDLAVTHAVLREKMAQEGVDLLEFATQQPEAGCTMSGQISHFPSPFRQASFDHHRPSRKHLDRRRTRDSTQCTLFLFVHFS